jgi:hypothetical protein
VTDYRSAASASGPSQNHLGLALIAAAIIWLTSPDTASLSPVVKGSAGGIPRSPHHCFFLRFFGQPRGVGTGQGARAGSPDHPPIGQSDGEQDLPLPSM